jgi:hypothetical protein
MTSPREIADSVRAIAADPNRIDERARQLIFTARLHNREARDLWLSLRSDIPDYMAGLTVRHTGTDIDLEAGADFGRDEIFDLVIQKAPCQELRIFLANFVGPIIQNSGLDATCIRVAEMEIAERFESGCAVVQPWTGEPGEQCLQQETLPDPRKFVKDFSSRGFVPADVRPWLLRQAPAIRGAAFTSWSAIAVRKALSVMVDHVSLDGDDPVYHLAGPPSRTFSIPDESLSAVFNPLQSAAQWIYLEGRDADTRHLFYAAEFARAYRPGELGDMAGRVLDSARIAYGAHAKSASRETLKALAELRKNVVDETQKITQRAQDLANSLWRDLAVAAAPFVLKILPDSSKVNEHLVTEWFAIGAALFLVFSFGIQASLNHTFFEQQRKSRLLWRQSLNPYISDSELTDFSDKPINEATRTYGRVQLLVAGVYVLLIAILLLFAASSFSARTSETVATSRPSQNVDTVPSNDKGGARNDEAKEAEPEPTTPAGIPPDAKSSMQGGPIDPTSGAHDTRAIPETNSDSSRTSAPSRDANQGPATVQQGD